MATAKVRPSDVVVWRQQPGNEQVFALRQLNRSTVLVDTQDRSNKRGEWTARMVYMGDSATGHLDPDDARWELVTQGKSKGGRRYRGWATFAEHQRTALAWLDRRFRVREEQ